MIYSYMIAIRSWLVADKNTTTALTVENVAK